jgi:hypothetical protein
MIVTSAKDHKIEKNHADDEDKEPHVEICSLLLEQFLTELVPITNNDESLRTRLLVLILNFKGLYCNRMKICFCAFIDLVLNVWSGQVAIVTCAIEELQW